MTMHETWLRTMRAAKRGGELWPQLGVNRGLAYRKTLLINADATGSSFEAYLAAEPESANGIPLSVDVGSFDGGYTPVTLSLTKSQVDALPADADLDGVEHLVLTVLHTPIGGTRGVLFAGVIPVLGNAIGVSVSTPPPVPPTITNLSIAPGTGDVGTTFSAMFNTANVVGNPTLTWVLSGTVIGTGMTITPQSAGILQVKGEVIGPGGSATALSPVAVVTASTPAVTAPAAPTVAVDPGILSNTIAITTVSDGGAPITARLIYRGAAANFTPTGASLIATLTSADTYVDTGLTAGTPYHYRVQLKNAASLTSPASISKSGIPIAPDTETVLSNGELTPAYFAEGSVTPQWPSDPTVRRWSPPVGFMVAIPGVTEGFDQITTTGTNAAPDWRETGLEQQFWLDGRTLIRPDPSNINGYIPAKNSFEFGEAPAPRNYTFQGGKDIIMMAWHFGGYKTVFTNQTGVQYLEGIRFEGKVEVTAAITGTGPNRTFTVTDIPYSTQLQTWQRVLDADHNLIGYLTGGTGMIRTLQIYEADSWANRSGTFYLVYPGSDFVMLQGNSNLAQTQPVGIVQGLIGTGLNGVNRDQRRISGGSAGGGGAAGEADNLLIPADVEQTGTKQVTVTLPAEDFPGTVKVHGAFTASISGTTLTVTAKASGTIGAGMVIPTSSGAVSGTYIESQLTGTAGGVGTYQISKSQTVASRAMIVIPYAFKLIQSTIGGVRSPLNQGFNTDYNFVSWDPATRKLVLTYANESMVTNKPAVGTHADARPVFLVALSAIPGEHADLFQIEKTKEHGGVKADSWSTESNYNAGIIAGISEQGNFPIDFSRADLRHDPTITPLQDLSTEWSRFGTTAAQTALRVFKLVFALLRPGASIAGSAFPSINNGEGGVVTTATVDGETRPAVRWTRENFLGIAIQGLAAGGVRYGRAGAAAHHRGFDYKLTKYEGERIPLAADLTAISFIDAEGVERTSAIALKNDATANQVFGRFNLEHTLPPGFHLIDGYLTLGAGLGKRLKTRGNRLLRSSAMLPAAGTYPGALTLLAMAQVNFKATISGTTMTVPAGGVITGCLRVGAAIRGPGITGAPTIISGPSSGHNGVYTLSSAPGDAASPVNLLATSPVQISKSFDVVVQNGTFATSSGAFTRTFEGSQFSASETATNASQTFTVLLSAPATSDRLLVIRVGARALANRTLVGVKANGVFMEQAALSVNNSSSTNYSYAGIFQALVPTGSSVTIEVVFSGAISAVGIAATCYRGAKRSAATGLAMIYDSATAGAATNIGTSTKIHRAAGGYVEAVQYFSAAPASGNATISYAAGPIGSTADDATLSNEIGGTNAAPTCTWTGAAQDEPPVIITNGGSGATAMAAVVIIPAA